MADRYFPIPTSCEVTLLNGTGAGPLTLVPASAGLYGCIWSIENVLSGTTTQTIKSGTTEIDVRRTGTTRASQAPTGHPHDEQAMPYMQSVNAGEAITIEFSGSITYSIRVRYTYQA